MHIEQSRNHLVTQMIEQQVRAWDVLDERVLDVLRRVPRERFVPEQHRYLAFADVEIPLPEGQHMLRPSVVGRLLQSLELTGSERVLEIGSGSGYVTACLSALSSSLVSLEIFRELGELARSNLTAQHVRSADVVIADATQFEPDTRFDAIAVTGSLPIEDERFQQWLEIGGRMFVIVGEPPVMDARLVRRAAERAWTSASLFETVIDALVNARRPAEFEF